MCAESKSSHFGHTLGRPLHLKSLAIFARGLNVVSYMAFVWQVYVMTMKPCLQLIRTMKWVGAASIFGCQPGAELTEEDHEVWIVDQGASFIGAYGLGDGEYRSTVLELEEGVEASALVELNGQIVLTDFSSGDVLSYNRTERGLEEVVWENGAEGTRPRLEEPCAIDVVDGSLWVLGNDSRNVLAFTGAGTEEVVSPSNVFRHPHDFAHSEAGWLYVSTSPSQRNVGLIQVWDPIDMKLVADFGWLDELQDGTSLFFDSDQTLLVADFVGNQVLRFDPETGDVIEVVLSEPDGLRNPVKMAHHPVTGLLVLDQEGLLHVDEGHVERLIDGANHNWVFPRNLLVVPTPPID